MGGMSRLVGVEEWHVATNRRKEEEEAREVTGGMTGWGQGQEKG